MRHRCEQPPLLAPHGLTPEKEGCEVFTANLLALTQKQDKHAHARIKSKILQTSKQKKRHWNTPCMSTYSNNQHEEFAHQTMKTRNREKSKAVLLVNKLLLKCTHLAVTAQLLLLYVCIPG